MAFSLRTSRAAIALTLAAWSQACAVYRAPPANLALTQGQRVRVSSVVPFALGHAHGATGAGPACLVTSVEGAVSRVAGDTIVLAGVRAAVRAAQPDGSRPRCPAPTATIVRTPETDVMLRHIDRGRTTALVLGIAAVIIGLLAYAASQIETGFPDGGDCTFCARPVGSAMPARQAP